MSNNAIDSQYIIDEDIRGLVEFCNINGIKTLASCSGTIKDHEDLMGLGQLSIKDSKLSRKIASAIIERRICRTDLYSKPAEELELYDNIISYPHINFSFENPDNEILPKIEEVVRQVVERKIEPNEEIMNKVNQIFDFFDSIDRRVNITYTVNSPDFSGELTFDTDNITSKKRVDKESIVKNIVKLTGKRRVDYGYYIGVIIEENDCLQDTLSKVKMAVKTAPSISKRKEIKRDREREKMALEKHAIDEENLQAQCKTSQPLEELLGTQINTPEEIVVLDVKGKHKSSGAKSDVIVEPWNSL